MRPAAPVADPPRGCAGAASPGRSENCKSATSLDAQSERDSRVGMCSYAVLTEARQRAGGRQLWLMIPSRRSIDELS
jgi:hypothetical protein